MSSILVGEDITVRFGGLYALTDVNIAVNEHETTALIGANGAGKTTLVNVLSGLAAPTHGRVLLRGSSPRRWGLGAATRAGVVRTFQANRVFADRTVSENLMVGKLNAREDVDAGEVLDVMGLADRSDVMAKELSFGEMRRLGVALALSTAPDVLLLDEPGAGLTGEDLNMLAESIATIREQGKAVLVIDHNMGFVMSIADRVVALDGGRVIAEGAPRDVQNDPRVRASYLGVRHDA